MTVALYQTADFGANPFNLDGPVNLTAGVSGQGIVLPQFKPGHTAFGDCESEYVYCKLVLASATTLTPGDLYQWDDTFTATLLTTAGSLRGSPVGVGLVNFPSTNQAAAGTYFLWLLRAGQAPVRYTTLTANNLTETTATGGACNSPASPTVGSKLITGLYYTRSAPATFTADVTNGSPTLINLTGVSLSTGPFVGATLSGTGIAASQKIASINVSAQGVPVSITMDANATATNTGVTITPTLVQEARVRWPYIDKTN
jgi:hypothetical protein